MPELRDVMWRWLGSFCGSERGAIAEDETRLGRAAVMCSYRLVKCSAL